MRKPMNGTFVLLAVAGALFALSFPSIKLALGIHAGLPLNVLASRGFYVLGALVLAIVASVTLIGGRYSRLSLALYLFALSRSAQPAGMWIGVLPGAWKWLGELFAAGVAGASVYGYVALCLRMPTGRAMDRWRIVDGLLPFYSVLVGLVYAGSIALARLVPASSPSHDIPFVILLWIGYLVGAIAYLARRRTVSGQERLRTRWVALAIVSHVVFEVAVHVLPFHASSYLYILDPAPYAFAYALISVRVVDIRVFGGRALVYAVLTSIPVVAFTLIDWFFGQQLQNLKLASALLVAIAIGFSFWLNALHRRIERFVERVMFARRHRAHQAIDRMTGALPFVERTSSLRTMLVDDVSRLLQFRSAALYVHDAQGFKLQASTGVEDLPVRLDADDPLVLYPRSGRQPISLQAVPGSSRSLPACEDAPAYALPVVGGNTTYAVVLYGEHFSGEAVDGEEEKLLLRLAHGAANAYEHLLLRDREREIAELRVLLDKARDAGVVAN